MPENEPTQPTDQDNAPENKPGEVKWSDIFDPNATRDYPVLEPGQESTEGEKTLAKARAEIGPLRQVLKDLERKEIEIKREIENTKGQIENIKEEAKNKIKDNIKQKESKN